MKQAIEEIEEETPSVDKLLDDEEDNNDNDKDKQKDKEAELLYFGFNLQKGVIITKQGNQFYLEFQIEDENEQLLDTTSILKVQFVIGDLIKTYDGVGDEVIYDSANKIFKVWVTEEETFKFDKQVKMDARVLFKGDKNTIGGTYIEQIYWYDTITKEKINV